MVLKWDEGRPSLPLINLSIDEQPFHDIRDHFITGIGKWFAAKTIEFKARRARVESLTFPRHVKVKPLIFHPQRATTMMKDCI